MPASSHPAAPLLRALEGRVLPLLRSDPQKHIVIARSSRTLLRLSPEVHAVPLQRRGRRVAVRNSGLFDRAALLSGRWPLDGMRELRVPKLMIVASGHAGYRIADYVLQCPPGTAVFLPSGTPHGDGSIAHLETLSPEYQSCSLLWMTPMVSGLGCRMCHSEREKHLSPGQGEKVFLHNPRLLQLFSLLAEEAEEIVSTQADAEEASPAVFNDLFCGFLQAVARDIARERFLSQEVPPHEEQSTRSGGDPIEAAIRYISTHYASTLMLDDVARRFLLSRAQFTRKFRERTGQSFLEFLNARRLEQAKKLLAETQWTAAMISRYVGFKSPAYFHRLFTRETGVSPIEFRRRSALPAHKAMRSETLL